MLQYTHTLRLLQAMAIHLSARGFKRNDCEFLDSERMRMLLRESVPWGWRDQWGTALLARTLGKEWSALTSLVSFKSHVIISTLKRNDGLYFCPWKCSKAWGHRLRKKSDRLRWKKMKSLYKTKESFPLRVFIKLTALPLNNWVNAEGVWPFKRSDFSEDKSN